MNHSEQPTTSTNASVDASSRGPVLVVVESYMFVLLNLAAFVGNTLVCMALYRNTSLRTITNNFILSLSLTDLLMAVLVMPFEVSASFTDEWIGGTLTLEIVGYCAFILAGTSMFTVIQLAINRYFRVVKPILYRTIYSMKSSAVMAVTTWIFSAVSNGISLSVLGLEFRISPANPTHILPKFPSGSSLTLLSALLSLSFVVSGLVITLCYVRIYQTIRHHNTAAAPSSRQGHSSYGVEEAKITRILTVVLISLYLCWLPPFVAGILDGFELIGENSLKYRNFFYTFPTFVSSVINPLIYATMSRSFRNEFLKIIRFEM